MKHLFRTAAVTAALCAAMSMTAFAGQWQQDGTGYWWQDDDGSYPTNTWRWLDGKWYYLNADGSMATGWKFVDGKWYYLQSDGSMAVNTWIDGYYLNGSGTY